MCATKDRGLGIECIGTTVFMVVIKPLYPVSPDKLNAETY